MADGSQQVPPLIDLDDETQPPFDSQQLPPDDEGYRNMQLQTLAPSQQVDYSIELPVAQAIMPLVACPPKIKIGKYIYCYQQNEAGTRQVSQGEGLGCLVIMVRGVCL